MGAEAKERTRVAGGMLASPRRYASILLPRIHGLPALFVRACYLGSYTVLGARLLNATGTFHIKSAVPEYFPTPCRRRYLEQNF